MKTKYVLAGCLLLAILAISTQAQNSFDAFWVKFKSAVLKGDKAAVANLTRFPFSLGYDPSAKNQEGMIRTRASFLRRYKYIFDDEVNSVKCFQKNAPEKDSKDYFVACSFKNQPADAEKPFVYTFKLTKQGWRFVEFTNINE